MLLHALVREIEIIGEAAGRISPGVRRTLKGIPWETIQGMRNRLVHAYFDIDLDVVGSTLRKDLPDLLEVVEAALAEME